MSKTQPPTGHSLGPEFDELVAERDRVDPVKNRIGLRWVAFYGASIGLDGSVPPEHPEVGRYVGPVEFPGMIPGRLVSEPGGDACGRHIVELDPTRQSWVPCIIREFNEYAMYDVMQALDAWVGIGGDQDSPYERRKIKIRAEGPMRWVWAWVKKQPEQQQAA